MQLRDHPDHGLQHARQALQQYLARRVISRARRFILFHDKRHPRDLGAAEVEAFLTYLAVERGVSASTQNQAKSALLFLYKEVLGIALPWLRFSVWHKRTRVPFVPMRWRDGCARY
ncbi:MAG: phage integrase N-terminal SAM-like domain-containing protein [Burkholderiales bacterium]